MNFEKRVLANGLRVIVIPMPSFESVTVLAMVGAGSRYETLKNNGISHFLEHMAFKGTEKRPSAMIISSIIDGIGGEFNAFTGKESTGYYIKSSSNHAELSMDMISDMLTHSLLDPNEIEKEKGVIIEEINLYEDTPMRKIGDIYERLLYGNTPMGWDIAGEKDIIMSLKREDFVNYMASLYGANNITLVIAGGIDTEEMFSLAEKYFGKMSKFDTLRYKKVIDRQEKPEVMIRYKDTEQVHLALGVRTVDIDHLDKYPLSILAAIVGGGMSSRLFHEIREKRGLAYYVRTHSDHYMDTGSFVSTAGVDSKRIDDAIKVMVDEYRAIATGKKPVTLEELTKAKEFTKGHLVLELEDSRSVAAYYASQELLEKELLNPDEVIKKTDEVTLKQVQDIAKKYLTRPFNLAVIGNFKEKERFEKLIA